MHKKDELQLFKSSLCCSELPPASVHSSVSLTEGYMSVCSSSGHKGTLYLFPEFFSSHSTTNERSQIRPSWPDGWQNAHKLLGD